MKSHIRVLVIDDSAYNRRTIIKMLESVPGVEIAGYATNGEEGLRKVFELKPDLVTVDLEMPRMDGFSFLRFVMQKRPTPVIVVSSRSENENVFKALELGAVEFIAKPSGRISPELFNIRDDLLCKVREIARTDMNKVLGRSIPHPLTASNTTTQDLSRLLKEETEGAVRQVVIGASTGGPPALQAIFSAIQSPLPVGFAVSQHMPPGFTKAFADRLNKYCRLEIREARSGDIMHPGLVLVAPGAKNLVFRRSGSDVIVQVAEPALNQRYVPSVDVMFSSASEIYGSDLLGVILTGMGNDGARGVRDVVSRGGSAIAESEETSVVFGMPKEAIATGKVDKSLPLHEIGLEILRRCGYPKETV